MNNKKRKFLRLGFACYCIALFSILFLRYGGSFQNLTVRSYFGWVLDRINLIPFSSIREQLFSVGQNGAYTRRVAIRNLAANALIFVPMGLFLPLLWVKLRRFRVCIPVWFGVIFLIEIIQLLTLRGSFDIDDVILNSLGFLAGFCVFSILTVFTREEK